MLNRVSGKLLKFGGALGLPFKMLLCHPEGVDGSKLFRLGQRPVVELVEHDALSQDVTKKYCPSARKLFTSRAPWAINPTGVETPLFPH